MPSFDHIRPTSSGMAPQITEGAPYLLTLRFGAAWARDLERDNFVYAVPYGITSADLRNNDWKKTTFRWSLTYAADSFGTEFFEGPDMVKALTRAVRALEDRVLNERRQLSSTYKDTLDREISSPRSKRWLFRASKVADETMMISGHAFNARPIKLANGNIRQMPHGIRQSHDGWLVEFAGQYFPHRIFRYPDQSMALDDAIAELKLRVQMVDATLKRRNKDAVVGSSEMPFGLYNLKFNPGTVSAGSFFYLRTGINGVPKLEIRVAVRITDPMFLLRNRVAAALRFYRALDSWIDERVSAADFDAIAKVSQCDLPAAVLSAIDATKVSQCEIDAAVRHIVERVSVNRNQKKLSAKRNVASASLARMHAALNG